MSKESPGAKNPDPSIGHSVVSGRTNAQKIQAKKKKQRWRNYVKMRKTLSEDMGDVVNLFHDCSNNNFKNESNGREGSSAHTTDGGDGGKIIIAGGEAKSESAKDNRGSIIVPDGTSLAGCCGSLEIILGESATTFLVTFVS